VTGPARLPRRDDDMPPDWWAPYKAEFPRWRAWCGTCQFWARLPGTMRVYHADDPAGLASQIRAADTDALPVRQVSQYRHPTYTGDLNEQ
jgi:hypothetical protein